jgi:glycosyltransferase involved in cell wall biosynthesis
VVSSQAAPLRVLQVTARYFPYTGGVENHVYEVSRRLAQAGAEVTILTTDLTGELSAHEEADNVKILRVRAWPTDRDYYFAPEIYRLIREGGWDVVHCQCYHTLVPPLAMLAAWRAKIPYVLTFHGGGHSSRLRNALRGAQWMALRPLLARAQRLIATAGFEIPLFARRLRLPPDRFVYIPNGSDLCDLAPATPAPTDGPLVASVGRLERYKGHHRVLAALPRVLEQRPDVRLRIVGTGPYESDLRRQARALGVADRVEVRGVSPTDREAMASLLASTALVTLLSEYETHPMAVLEALALGRPALVADTSGLSELAQQGLVRAVALDSSPDQVAAAILEQLRHPLVPPKVRLPSWDACAAELLSLYRSVARGAACAS